MVTSTALLIPSAPAEAEPKAEVPREWEAELKRLTTDLVTATNNRTIGQVAQKYFAPDFTTSIDFGTPEEQKSTSGPAAIAHIQQEVEHGVAGTDVRVEGMTVDFSRNMSTASVWLEMVNIGYPDRGMRTKAFSLFKWRRREGRWLCYSHRHVKNLCENGPEE